MATVKGSASYKKKDGALLVLKDSVTWTPAAPPGAPPSLTIPTSTITNLQATPATTAKVMIKVFAKTLPDKDPEQYVFTFTSPPPTARTEADAVKEALTTRIQDSKTTSGPATPSASASTTTLPDPADWSKSRLENDMALQQSLLKSNADLSKTFSEAVLSNAVTATQFWSTRTHLLRAHAIEREQRRGPYNVLATIKPKTEDGVGKISISQDVIRDIFEQHPLVKSVYDENVPKISDTAFWMRFFMSRLFKKLKGEKPLPTDGTDGIFDRYLYRDDEENSRKRRRIETLPRTIDLEGNEQNLSQKQGNMPDLTMRPTKVENVPIIRTLNSLSQKLVDLVAPADSDPTTTEDQDTLTILSQTLHDLRADPTEERIILNIRDQRRFFSGSDSAAAAAAAAATTPYASLAPDAVLAQLRSSLGDRPIDLEALLPNGNGDGDGDDDDGDGGDEEKARKRPRPSDAAAQVVAAVKSRRAAMLDAGARTGYNSSRTGGLPASVFESVTLVHATTHEFLRHFWLAFLSGDEKRAGDITKLVASLGNSKGRIEAIAAMADREKEEERGRRKREAQEEYRKTGVKPKKRSMEVGGGRGVVERILGPTIRAVEMAVGRYGAAVEEAERVNAAA
ncbi:uncharacterized protein H6S33_010411 [Morchella sextelata]|uniref:uncharacterized protein n=1 Tax=Morchella sextelata TaxID=1174677 RepID=UPI001D053AA9|nr:uncharacterized protein H6S33_010411 [Morchella sextelata]KAH0612359.1 hypothetical protein H6S33_010411 [Morchella sextelata]